MEWIPVDGKNLPEDHDEVLVVYPYYQDPVTIATFHKYGDSKIEWIDLDGYRISPTHWMPKPEPPK